MEQTVPFLPDSKDRLNGAVDRLIHLYTKCVARGNRNLAKQQLKLFQRENIAWERDTVWRQMIGRERRGEGVASNLLGATLVKEPQPGLFAIPTPFGRLFITRRFLYLVIALVVFAVLLNVEVVQGHEANRCFAVLVFCTVLWATEVIESFLPRTYQILLSVGYTSLRHIYPRTFTPCMLPSGTWSETIL